METKDNDFVVSLQLKLGVSIKSTTTEMKKSQQTTLLIY